MKNKIKMILASIIFITITATTVNVTTDAATPVAPITAAETEAPVAAKEIVEEVATEPAEEVVVEDYSIISEESNIDYNLQVEENYDKIPTYIQSTLDAAGWTIIVSNNYMDEKELEYCEDGWDLMGVTTISDKEIAVREEYVNDALIHEIGHAIDYQLCVTDSQDFRDIYNAEKANFDVWECAGDTTYSTSTIKEYFAESLQQYFFAATELQNNCPATYSYIDYVIQNGVRP